MSCVHFDIAPEELYERPWTGPMFFQKTAQRYIISEYLITKYKLSYTSLVYS